jgi:hypothetical protein
VLLPDENAFAFLEGIAPFTLVLVSSNEGFYGAYFALVVGVQLLELLLIDAAIGKIIGRLANFNLQLVYELLGGGLSGRFSLGLRWGRRPFCSSRFWRRSGLLCSNRWSDWGW